MSVFSLSLHGFSVESFQNLGVALDNTARSGGRAKADAFVWNQTAYNTISPLVSGLCINASPSLEGIEEGAEGLPLFVVTREASEDSNGNAIAEIKACVFSVLYTEIANSARLAQKARHEKEDTNPDTRTKEKLLLDNAISRLNKPMRNLADCFRVGTHVSGILEHLCSENPSWSGLATVASKAVESHIFSNENGNMSFQTREKNGIINDHAISSLFEEREAIARLEASLDAKKEQISKRQAGARRAYYAQQEVVELVPDGRTKIAKNTPIVNQGEALTAIFNRGLTSEERENLRTKQEVAV